MSVPLVVCDFSGTLSVVEQGDRPVNLTWEEIVRKNEEVVAIVAIESVPAIVATQTCDAQRDEYVTLCQIVKLSQIRSFEEYKEKSTKNLAADLVNKNREMNGILYLPSDSRVGFSEKMAISFPSTIRVPREGLEKFKAYRSGRLNATAYEHFREKLSHFFHRYALNEWYILSKEEIAQHKRYSALPPEQLYDYQK